MGKAEVGTSPRSHVARGIIFAALGGTCWGFSGVCIQLCTSEYGLTVPWLTSIRLICGAIIFLIICAIAHRDTLKTILRDKRLIILLVAYALLGVLLPQFCYLSTIAWTNAGIATVLERLGLILVLIYVCIRARRRPNVREVLGVVLAIVGVYLIATQGRGDLFLPIEGLLWGSLLACTLVFYTVLPVKLLDQWGSVVTTGLAMLIAAVPATLIGQPWTLDVELTWQMVLVLAAMVTSGTILAYVFILQGIKDAGSMRAGLMGSFEPVSATVLSALWLGTDFSPITVVGIVLILIMTFLTRDYEEEDEARGEEFTAGEAIEEAMSAPPSMAVPPSGSASGPEASIAEPASGSVSRAGSASASRVGPASTPTSPGVSGPTTPNENESAPSAGAPPKRDQ